MAFTKDDLPPAEVYPDVEDTIIQEELDGDDEGSADAEATPDTDVVVDTPVVATADGVAEDTPPSEPEAVQGEAGTDLADKAAWWDSLQETYIRDPLVVMKGFMQTMTPAQQQQFLQQATEVATGPTVPWAEDSSEAETALRAEWANIQAIPQLAQGMDKALEMRDRYINDHDVRVATIEAQLEALQELLDVKLPGLDAAAFAKALDGKTNNREAVQKVYKPQASAAIVNKKQAAKARPKTPGNAAGSAPNVKGVKDMAAIMRQISGR